MEWLLELDKYLFVLINQSWETDWQNFLLPWWRNKLFWVPFYVFLLFFLFQNFGKQAWYFIVGLLLTITIADTVSSQVLKKNIRRPRPCHQEVAQEHPVHLRISCGSGYSFTSSHATNHFAISGFLFFVLGRRLKYRPWWLIFWAASIAYAQVYVGVHYPLDVLAGALLGWLIGSVTGRLLNNSGWLTPKKS